VAVNCTFAVGAGEATVGLTATDVTLGLPVAAVPCSDRMTGRCFRSVIIARLPFTVPAVAAVNFTVKLWLSLGASTTGVLSPDMLNPAPVRIAWLTLTDVVPTFVIVATCWVEVPTLALTERLAGVTAREGKGSATPAHPDIHAVATMEHI
jgi:ABC-type sugar transport system permease subunit